MSITTSTTCFLKPPSSPPTNPKQQQQLIIPRPTSDRPLARRCVAGIACVAIGLELIDHNLALAMGDPKWSDKRTCPAWQMNSLETIVPENLPRPSAKRRWEIVGFDSSPQPSDPTAAKIRIRVFRNGNGCFSM